MIASRCRSDLTPGTTSPPFGVNGSRKNGFVVTVSTRVPAHSFPSDAICKRRPAGLWFRGNFAFGWFTDLPD
jgi:hypothetical protein